ncbi:MAG: phosphatidate cytidylyltransferase [Desulfuromonadales bacterium]|nr:phosphatidate cytidylyltransferase [Desulfuromonadales bacterium]
MIYANYFFFSLLIGGVICLALHEFFAMTLPGERRAEKFAAGLCALGLLSAMIQQSPLLLVGLLTLMTLGFGCWFLLRFNNLEKVTGQLAILLFGILYIALLFGHVALLRGVPDGREWIFLVLFIVMICDTCAYFVGSAIGCRRLYRSISPKKSIEGACGGLLGSILGALLVKFWFFGHLRLVDAVILGILLGIVGQLGDLFESLLKRGANVKDSGTLIPGHGGVLDRLDSLLFAFPVAYYYALWAGYG